MALTQVSTAGVKDDAVTSGKIPANAVGSSEIAADAVTNAQIADNAIQAENILDQQVTLAKLPHGTSSNDGKFLRANNGADPSFESIPAGVTINNQADNRVITATGTTDTLNGESNLTFDGGNLISKGDTGITVQATSTNTAGQLTIIGVNNSNQVSAITRIKSVSTDSSSAATATTFSNRNSSNAVNEHMRILSDGKIGMGTTSPATNLDVKTDHASNEANFLVRNSTVNYKVRALSDQAQAGTETNHPFYAISNNQYVARFDGDGIKFGSDTAAANALDDYEEGTWSPAPEAANTSFSYGQEHGRYTKIGNVVHVTYSFNASTSGTSGYALFINLPIQVRNFNAGDVNEGIGYSKGTGVEIQLEAQQGQSRMKLRSPSSGAALTPNSVGMVNNVTKTFRGAITYLTT